VRSRAFGYLGGVVGISTALGPLISGVLIQFTGMSDGWRWVFLVNLFIGVVAIPVAVKVVPRRHEREEHDLDITGSGLLTGVLLLVLVPLVDGRVAGWPLWSWIVLAASVPAGAVLAAWEIRLARRGGEPVLQVHLLRHRSFAMGQALALLYFAGFTSLFFTCRSCGSRAWAAARCRLACSCCPSRWPAWAPRRTATGSPPASAAGPCRAASPPCPPGWP